MAYLFVGLAIIFWASAPAVGKLLVGNLDVLQLLFFSLLFCLVFMLAAITAGGRLRTLKDVSAGTMAKRCLLGMTGVFLYYVCFYGSLSLLRAQETLIINYLWPIFVVLFARLILRERFAPLDGISFTAAFAGVFLSITNGNLSAFSPSNIVGIILALAGAVSYGLFSVLGKKFRCNGPADIFYAFFFAWLLTAACLGLCSGFPSLTGKQVAGLAFVGITNYALAFFCWTQALKRGKTATVSLLIYLTPFVALVYIRALLREAISPWSIIGLVVMMAGIVLKLVRCQKRDKNGMQNAG
jgi:drug/metabolite transporter (DMT)-like permease